MFNGNTSGANQLLTQMDGLLNTAQEAMQQNLSQLNTNGDGVLDPVQMSQLQIYTQNYLAFLNTMTSLIKQFGDADKQVATNIGQ